MDSSESDSEFELDCNVWGLHLTKSATAQPLCAVWAGPPTSGRCSRKQSYAQLASHARRTFTKSSNDSFWVPACASPTTPLEQFALDVFWFHAKRLGWSRRAIERMGRAAGAEYWVQRRTSSMARTHRGINWHFDKDEDLLDDFDLTVHPLLGTVTYLGRGGAGAPLVVLQRPTLNVGPDGADLQPVAQEQTSEAFVVYPTLGRHVAFRGNSMHGCPIELEQRKGERLSVLVNLWLRHRPLGLQRVASRARKSSETNQAMRGSSIQIRTGRRLGVSQLAANSVESVELPVTCGRWKLSGLRLPQSLHPSKIWSVIQARGQPSLPGKAKRRNSRKPAASGGRATSAIPADSAARHPVKRPASSVLDSRGKRPRHTPA